MSEQITFYVATNLDYFGDGADQETVDDYIEFAQDYLVAQGYDVEIETVENYKSWGEQAEQYNLREQVWLAYCGQ